jgi:hypothetical protein
MTTETPTAPATPAAPPTPAISANAQPAISGSVTISDAELHATANRLISKGVDVARVREIMAEAGHAEWQPDARTPDQVQHDKIFDIRSLPPTAFNFPLPPADAVTDGGDQQLFAINAGVQSLVADLGMDRNAGNKFSRDLLSTTAALRAMSPDQLAETSEQWTAALEAAFGDRLPEVTKAVEDLLRSSKSPLAAHLLKAGVMSGELRSPGLFGWLAARAAARSLWSTTRPK